MENADMTKTTVINELNNFKLLRIEITSIPVSMLGF